MKRQLVGHQRRFSVLLAAVSSEPLDVRPTLLYSDMESFIGFPLIPKHVTLKDLEWLFRVKYTLRACRSRTFLHGFPKQSHKSK